MKFVSWNVNGLRACMGKGFMDSFNEMDADFFCLQETKLQPDQISLELPGYYQFWNSAEKKGYSGTAIFTKHEPLSVNYGIDVERHDHEGRVITLEYPDFYLVDVYVPNARRNLERLDYRMDWEDSFREYVSSLDKHKPVIICGDMNVAHEEIDLKNYKTNRGNAGFTDEERSKMTELLGAGFADTFRFLIRKKAIPIPGGAICSTQGKRMPDGESTILSVQSVFVKNLRTALSIRNITEATIARLQSLQKIDIRQNPQRKSLCGFSVF